MLFVVFALFLCCIQFQYGLSDHAVLGLVLVVTCAEVEPTLVLMIQPGAAPTAPIIVIVCGEKERMRLLIIKPWAIHFLNSVVVYLEVQPARNCILTWHNLKPKESTGVHPNF